MTYKEATKKDLDQYIKNRDKATPRAKGTRPEAWADVKALEILVKAARG